MTTEPSEGPVAAGARQSATTPQRWLDARDPLPPAPVRRAVADALTRLDPGAGDVSERLAATGLALLETVAGGAGDRASAVELLAADALLTCAIEAAAEEGRDALDRRLASLDLDRFERMLQPGDVDR